MNKQNEWSEEMDRKRVWRWKMDEDKRHKMKDQVFVHFLLLWLPKLFHVPSFDTSATGSRWWWWKCRSRSFEGWNWQRRKIHFFFVTCLCRLLRNEVIDTLPVLPVIQNQNHRLYKFTIHINLWTSLVWLLHFLSHTNHWQDKTCVTILNVKDTHTIRIFDCVPLISPQIKKQLHL